MFLKKEDQNKKSMKRINLVFASFFFSLMTLCVKKTDSIPIFELVFFRSFLSLAITPL